VTEEDAAARWQFYGARYLPATEVVNVAPFVGSWLCGCLPLKKAPHAGELSRACWPQQEKVEAFSAYAGPEFNCFEGAILPHELGEFLQFSGARKLELGDLAVLMECFRS